MKHGNMPYHLYVLVPNALLTNGVNTGYTRGIWWGVYCRLGQHLMSHVLLESGANWTGIHVKDLIADDGKSKSLENINFYNNLEQPLFPWAAMGDDVEVFPANYLEGLDVKDARNGKPLGRHTGLMFDWRDGFSRYPQEHKPLNLIALTDSPQFAMLPNNFCLFQDKHFITKTQDPNIKNYRRGADVKWE